MFDEADAHILKRLEEDGKTKLDSMASELGIGRQAVWKRIHRMRSKGQIKKFTVDVDAERCGYNFFAFVMAITKEYKKNEKKIHEAIKKNPYIHSAYKVSGEYDIIMLVCDKDAKTYGKNVTQNVFGPLEPYLRSFSTVTAFEPIKGEYPLAVDRILADVLKIDAGDISSMTKERTNVPGWDNIATVWADLPNYYRPSEEVTQLAFSFVTSCRNILVTGASTTTWINRSQLFAEKVHVIDIYHAFLEAAQKRYEKTEKVKLHRDDARRMHFEDGTFDIVLSERLIPYFSDDGLRAFLTQAFRVLRPGGHLIICSSSQGCFDEWVSFSKHYGVEYAIDTDSKVINYSLLAKKAPEGLSKKENVKESVVHDFYHRVFAFHCRSAEELASIIELEFPAEVVHLEEVDKGRNSFIVARRS